MQDLYGLGMDFLNQAFDDSFTNITVSYTHLTLPTTPYV